MGNTLCLRIPLNVNPKIIQWINTQTSINNSILLALENYINTNGISDITSDMGKIPSNKCLAQHIMAYIRACNTDGKQPLGANVQEIYNYCSKIGNLKLNSTEETKLKNRIRVELNDLKARNIIKSTTRGFYNLTE